MTTTTLNSGTIVAPQNGRGETLLVAVTALVVLAISVFFALTQPPQGRGADLTDWQLNAFDDLGPVDRAMFSALLSATEEITFVQQEYAQWLTVEDLESQYIPPFPQDAFWRANGEVMWELHHPVGEAENAQGTTFYFGSGGTAEGQGAYLIVQRHSHAGFNAITEPEIWLNPNPDIDLPTELRQDSLIRAGWKQVIAYSGADEALRIR